ncbi:MAG: EpsI family protein [Aquabacterium sp.]|nr:EpsI family protein [Aquabacterium sp.]
MNKMLSGPWRIHARTWVLASILCGAALAARLAQPTLHERGDEPQLETSIPNKIGPWSALASPITQVSITQGNTPDINQPYDQSVLRTYVDNQGHQIGVAVAWGKHQRQEVKIHRPELCYPAQGYAVQKLRDHTFTIKSMTSQQPIIGKRMIALDRNGSMEVVSYWIRIGSIYSDSALKTRMHILQEGLAGRVTDGLLMRVSQRMPASAEPDQLESAFQRQEQFAAEIVRSVTPATRDLLAR